MINKPVYTEEEVAQIKALQEKVAAKHNLRMHERRRDAEDRAAEKAMADD
jgi:hypothetical protein